MVVEWDDVGTDVGDVTAVGDGDVTAVGDVDVTVVGDGGVTAVGDGGVQWRSEGNWRPGAKLNFAPPLFKKILKMILKCL